MRDGFYSVRLAGADQDPFDDEAWGLAMLVHFRNGRAIGVDLGGCRISGSYLYRRDGGVIFHMRYELRCGSHMPDGTILQSDHTIERELAMNADAIAGGHQLADAGLGPMFLKFEWLADGI